MGIPDFQSIMLPLLSLASDGREHAFRDAIETLAIDFSLSDEERAARLPSGRAATFSNRVGWASTHLRKAGLLETTRRGFFKITERGEKILSNPPVKIDIGFLEQFNEFLQFRNATRDRGLKEVQTASEVVLTPEESMDVAYQKLREGLSSELLQTIKGCTPGFFERLVVDLLVKMGYGGSLREAGQALGRSGDGGIDGIIKEDKLGLDIIYIQAKRWDGSVGRPEVQKFAGALQGQRARKGIFITTSSFTKDAAEYASFIDTKMILIDGARLTELMIDHGVGVTTQAIYEVRRIDSDYFTEE